MENLTMEQIAEADDNAVVQMYKVNDLASEMLNEATHGEHIEPESVFSDFQNKLTREAKAMLLFQLLGDTGDVDTAQLSKDGKALALELADVSGGDFDQLFYRFIVLVTKLA